MPELGAEIYSYGNDDDEEPPPPENVPPAEKFTILVAFNKTDSS